MSKQAEIHGSSTPPARMLDDLLSRKRLAIGDLILTEVLQGFTSEADFRAAERMLPSLDIVELGGPEIAIQAAKTSVGSVVWASPPAKPSIR